MGWERKGSRCHSWERAVVSRLGGGYGVMEGRFRGNMVVGGLSICILGSGVVGRWDVVCRGWHGMVR